MKKKLFLLTFLSLFMTIINAQIVGDWKGSISVQGMELELIFHIADDNGQLQTTLDIPLQGATGIPVEKTEFENNELNLTLSALQAKFKGTLKDDKTIEGNFEQMGMSLPLNLTKFVSKLPGNPALVTSDEDLQKLINQDKRSYKYKVEDYFSRPKASAFQLSPDGKYMSYREKEENGTKRHIFVKEIATGKVTRILEEKEELIRGYFWKNNERILYMMDQGGNEQYHIHAVNIDGTNNVDLTPYAEVQANVISILKEQKDFVIIQMNKNNKQVFEPYKLNIVSGEIEQLFENKDIQNPIQGYDFDKDGNLRGYSRLVNGVESEQWYKNLATNEFELVKQMKWYDSFGISGFNYAGKNPDEAYVVTNLDSDKARIVLYDFKKNEIVKEVFSNPDFDATSMSRSRKRNYEIDYFAYEGEKYIIQPVSKFYKKFTKQMEKAFPNKECHIVGSDDDENTFLLMVQSDKLYGTYYQYDNKTKKFSLLYDLMPQLKEEDMAEMRPIKFTSRDGLTIYGYVTLPKEALNGKKVPLVVNPHGGPQGVRDSWGFNPETQLFASRGYATLQVNFRISGGYGKEFLKAGFKQVGRACMDDVEDGIHYLISQGMIDKDKIAIYGGSHGGYATLMGLVKTPDLYACGVDYVGVSNIFTFMKSIPEYWKPYLVMLKEIWYDTDLEEEAAIAREVSPAFQIDKIKSPLFVVQGANDPRVNINESDQIVEKLRAKGVNVPYMVKYNEGHGFAHEENSIEFYKAMMGFLSGYLK